MMRSLNFLFIFLICLVLVVFSLENTTTTTIQIANGVQIQAPLCIELIVATGFGAFLAWMFSLWSRLQRLLATREEMRQVRQKDRQIQQLKQDLEGYKDPVEPDSLASESPEVTVTVSEVVTNSTNG